MPQQNLIALTSKKNQPAVKALEKKVETVDHKATIAGRITDGDGQSVANARIVLVRKLLNTRVELGVTHTDRQGRYTIPLEKEKNNASVIAQRNTMLEVWSAKDQRLLKTVPVTLKTARSIRADVVVMNAVPLVQGLKSKIAQAGGPKKGPIAEDLHEELARLIGVDKQLIARYAQAASLTADLGVRQEWTFALLAKGTVRDRRSLFASSPGRLKRLIKQAITKGEISSISDNEIDRMTRRIQAKAVQAMSGKKLGDDHLPMGELLQLARADPKSRIRVAQHWHRHEGAPQRFWRTVIHDTGLPRAVRTQLEEVLELGLIASGDVQVAKTLKAIPSVRSPKDIARLTTEMLTRELKRVPSVDAKKAAELVAKVSARAKEAFPTTAFLHDVQQTQRTKVVSLLDVLHNDPKFDLHDSGLEPYLKKQRAFKALGKAKQTAVVEDLKKRQRLLRLGVTYGDTHALIAAGYDAAEKIVRHGKHAFLSKVGKQIGEENARAIYGRAEETNAKATMLLLQYGPTLNNPSTLATPVIPLQWDDSPNLKRLFEDQPLCACERCRSITGPAAYLVDLLQFLRNEDNNDPTKTNALAALTKVGAGRLGTRRPDLTGIKLSSENTNTQIPYLDIVLEVLENAVVTPIAVTLHQTAASEGEIDAASEHINMAAYTKVGKAVFPLNLPFDIYYEELQLIVAELGITRLELMEVFADLAQMADPNTEREYIAQTYENVLSSEKVAGEVFGMSTAERKVITGQPLSRGITLSSLFWGYTLLRTNWLTLLAVLSTFMQRSGLSYTEVLHLLALKALHVGHPLRLVSQDPAECDPNKITIQGLDATAATRLHRFIRLYRRTAWSMRDLDRALNALADKDGTGVLALDVQFLIRLSHVQRLCKRFSASVPEILSWWSDLDIADYNAEHLPQVRSFYQEMFERDMRSLVGNARLPLCEVRNPAAGTVTSKMDQLTAALDTPSSELDLLITHLGIGTQKVSVTNLSLLFRHVSLARRMGLGIPDFLTYLTLAGDPFLDTQSNPSSLPTLAFIDRWDSFRASEIPLEEINYFIGGVDRSDRPNAVNASKLIELAGRITADLHSAGADTPQRETVVIQLFAEHFGIDAVIMDLLLRTWLKSGDGTPFLTKLLLFDDVSFNPEFQNVYTRIHAIAWFMSYASPVEVNEAGWMFTQAPTAGFLDLAKLPLTPVDNTARQAGFLQWRRWERWLQLRSSLEQPKRQELVTLFALGSVSPTSGAAQTERKDYVEVLQAITEWNDLDIRLLLGKFDPATGHRMSILNTRFRSHFRDEQLPFQLLRCMQLVRRLGLSVSQLSPDALLFREPVANPAPLIAAARSALRARVGEAGWPAVAKRVRNSMREKQRRALVDYLVAAWDLKDSGALYDHFLLDVEMSACQKTTRIHAATHAVQLFVDRCLMNLEREVTITADGAEQWNWMKRYPIWEAHRKIFLYPENFLRSEFRDDRTPFFREFEDELKQSDITDATAEAALRHYLEKVDQVSRLQICGIYVEEGPKGEKSSVPEVHVFGRTRNSPHVYYYRKWVDYQKWTPWERVDVDIEGDHLIPVVYFGRVYLFWPVIAEKDGGPFNMDAFVKPFLDLLSFVTGLAQAGGAVAFALIGAYNEMLDAIERAVRRITLNQMSVNLDTFKIDQTDYTDLPQDPLKEAIEAVGAGMKLVFDTISLHPAFRVLDFLPKKEYDIQLAWSTYRHGPMDR